MSRKRKKMCVCIHKSCAQDFLLYIALFFFWFKFILNHTEHHTTKNMAQSRHRIKIVGT